MQRWEFTEQAYLAIRLAITNFKERNEGNYLGVVWFLLNPVLMFITLYYVFFQRLGTEVPHYALYLLLGIVQWNFLSIAVAASMDVVLRDARLVKSMPFPRHTLVIAGVLTALFTSAFEILVFLAATLFTGTLTPASFIFLGIIVLQILFVTGLCFIFASMIMYIHDLDNVWQFVSRLWWFGTPIFYILTENTSALGLVNRFNPMYYFVDMARDVLIYAQVPSIQSFSIATMFAVGSLCIGIIIFMILQRRFAELL